MVSRNFVPDHNGNIALVAFLAGIATYWIVFHLDLSVWLVCTALLSEVVYIVLVHVLDNIPPILQIVSCAHGLGIAFTTGLCMTISGQCYSNFGYYMVALSFFHLSEYILTSIFNEHTLSIDSFLLNHSPEYCIAAIASWVEFWIEYYFFAQFKCIHVVCIVGAVLVTGGEVLRKLAMFTAGSNFTHIVQYQKQYGHQLVTHGVYSLFRHPSYVGWFYWSIGTQVLLSNPVCLICYSVASWRFFEDRINDEELFLINFFGEDYVTYKKKVSSGIPFIEGLSLESPQIAKILEAKAKTS